MDKQKIEQIRQIVGSLGLQIEEHEAVYTVNFTDPAHREGFGGSDFPKDEIGMGQLERTVVLWWNHRDKFV